MEVLNPFKDEAPKPPIEIIEEIDSELEKLEVKKAYLLELKSFYENTGHISTNL
jgi:hypothetical protein